MANNRLYLVCRVCGDFYCIGKYYPDCGWYNQGGDTLFGYNDFLDKHGDHRNEQGLEYLYNNEGGDIFMVVSELDKKVRLYDFRNHKIELYPRYKLKLDKTL